MNQVHPQYNYETGLPESFDYICTCGYYMSLTTRESASVVFPCAGCGSEIHIEYAPLNQEESSILVWTEGGNVEGQP